MLHKVILIVSLFFCLSFRSQSLPGKFVQLLDSCKLDFSLSPALQEVPLNESQLIKYDYALKYRESNFYILYSLMPFDKSTSLKENRFTTKDESGKVMDPHIANFQKTVFDIFADQFFDYTLFDSLAVKQEFNADWGASTKFKLKKESYNGNLYCTMVALHKKEVGDVFMYFISDTQERFNDLMAPLFYNLKFRP